MSYKVNYYTIAKMDDGSTGNVKQSTGHFYTDSPITDIPSVLNTYLETKKRKGIITKIEDVQGVCL